MIYEASDKSKWEIDFIEEKVIYNPLDFDPGVSVFGTANSILEAEDNIENWINE